MAPTWNGESANLTASRALLGAQRDQGPLTAHQIQQAIAVEIDDDVRTELRCEGTQRTEIARGQLPAR
jgi:hypothetical protein